MSQDLFEAARPRIRGLAYRMLGTLADADDVAQDTWLRWQAAGGPHIANAEAWLVTAAPAFASTGSAPRPGPGRSTPGLAARADRD